MSLQVNTITGALKLLGDSSKSIDLKYYEITSASSSLDNVGWSGLADQDFEGNGPVDNTGNGLGGRRRRRLACSGGRLFAWHECDRPRCVGQPGKWIQWAGRQSTEIWLFTYGTEFGTIFEGMVEYVHVDSVAGDFDGDGDVDGADFLTFGNGASAQPTMPMIWPTGKQTTAQSRRWQRRRPQSPSQAASRSSLLAYSASPTAVRKQA